MEFRYCIDPTVALFKVIEITVNCVLARNGVIEVAILDHHLRLHETLYIVQSFTDRDMDIETYTECHKIIGAAWRRMNEDLEFCEQLELELPRSREWHRDREWGSVHDETYLTKEAHLKAVKAHKVQSEADPLSYL